MRRVVAALVVVCAAAATATFVRARSERVAPGPRVVAVAVTSPAGAAALATGFAARDGRVVTVAHALDGGGALTVGGRRASVIRVDRRDDLAVLAVPGMRAPRVATTSGSGAARVLLRAGPRPARVRRAITATVRIDPDAPVRRPALDLAADLEAGDSGAPVVDAHGRVIGVVFAASRDRPHTAYAVDASALRSLLTGS